MRIVTKSYLDGKLINPSGEIWVDEIKPYIQTLDNSGYNKEINIRPYFYEYENTLYIYKDIEITVKNKENNEPPLS